ncbi:pupal cuticle protein Edg-78E-like [Musca autumnalis]|uniref:pupal cuticle protein Edg-78E-like n=1 Tax=Musca autumnalis TaxID=221902 RepID=UPI003CF78232
MKLSMFFVLLALIPLSMGRLIDRRARILRSKYKRPDRKGNYYYAFETSNRIQVQEAGNPVGVTGEVNYVSPEGRLIELKYTADENGFHPVGKHLPTPPPTPDYILRSLEYIKAHPNSENRGMKLIKENIKPKRKYGRNKKRMQKRMK